MYKRVLLKLSGEAMAGSKGYGIDPQTISDMANEIKLLIDNDLQVSIVVGGGNILRGASAAEMGMDRSQADYMGMMATVINALALQDALESAGCQARVQSSLRVDQVCEPFIRRKAIRHMEKKRIVIVAGGTGMPYFTTDTNTMTKAAELNVDLVLMAKNGTDGVYDKDPNKFDDAKKFDKLTYEQIIENKLRVMDLTAATMASENNIASVVFNMSKSGNILKAVTTQEIGTLITNKEN